MIGLGLGLGFAKQSKTNAFSPTSISGLKLWLDASKLGLADNAPVASWTDYSGTGSHATQATPSSQPTFKTGIINGKPIVRFDGAVTELFGNTSITTTTLSCFLVVRVPADYIPYSRAFVIGATGQDDYTNPLYAALFTYQNLLLTTFRGTGADGAFAPFTTDVFQIDESITNGSYIENFVNGANQGQTFAITSAYNSPNFNVGGYIANNRLVMFKGDIAEIIMYAPMISPANRTKIINYLKAKYNL